jgi:hypothetical protein
MPSFVKTWVTSLLLWALSAPAWGTEARLRERAPLCPEPRAACTPLFYLNPGESVEVLRVSPEHEDWLAVRFGPGGREGWLPRNVLALNVPQALSPEVMARLPEGPGRFGFGEPLQFQIGLQAWHYTHEGLVPQPAWKVRSELLGRLIAISPAQAWGITTADTQAFVQHLRFTLSPRPQLETLLRLAQPTTEAFVAQTGPLTLVLGKGTGFWGESILVGLDAQGMPWLHVANSDDLPAFFPGALRARYQPRTCVPLALDAQGVLYAKAVRRSGETVIVMVLPSARAEWDYLGELTWPVDQPIPTAKDIPVVRAARGGGLTGLLVGSGVLQRLYLFALTGEQIWQGPVAEASDLHLDPQGQLWTLQGQQLLRWQAAAPTSAPRR